MNIIRWVAFLPATLIIYFLISNASESIFQIITGVQSKNDISMTAIIYKSSVGLFSAFLGSSVSCFIMPRGKLKMSIIYLIFNSFSVNLIFLNTKFNNPDVWRYSTPIIFSVIGCVLSVFIVKSQIKRNFSKVEVGFLIYSLSSLSIFILSLALISVDTSISEAIGIFVGLLVTIAFIIVQLVQIKKGRRHYAQT